VRKARMRKGFALELEERGDLLQDLRHRLLVHVVLQRIHRPARGSPRERTARQPSSSSLRRPGCNRRRSRPSERRAACRHRASAGGRGPRFPPR
jgi:hypothetical protein